LKKLRLKKVEWTTKKHEAYSDVIDSLRFTMSDG